MNILQRWGKYLATRSLHRETVKQLNRLTDRELKDIGLNRSDISRMIWLDEDMKQRGDRVEPVFKTTRKDDGLNRLRKEMMNDE